MKYNAKRKLFVHGTSSVKVPSILSQGMVPDPKGKTNLGWETPHSGSYWASDISYANDYATAAASKFGGWPTYIFAVIETRDQNVVLDEDSIGQYLFRTLSGAATPDSAIESLQLKFPHIPKIRWERRKEDIKKYLESIYSVDTKERRNQENDLLKKLTDIATDAEQVRVKDRAVGYKGSHKIVYIGSITSNGVKQHYRSRDPEAQDAQKILESESKRYKYENIKEQPIKPVKSPSHALASLADILDRKGLYAEADIVDEVLGSLHRS